eukprot:TRINITY_DN8124_c0_g1_i1.p1 TRINITY_DN8124_c0_g1~~TRINITY_DN8124_c0_g1_i1.p1  ORF type:complete len:621 (+),score=68.07 TRINITY_DN8124_c0_g1_i1:51-1913(+)
MDQRQCREAKQAVAVSVERSHRRSDAVDMVAVSPMSKLNDFWTNLTNTFGTRFLQFLIVVYCGVKGVAFNTLTSVQLPVFQSLGVSGIKFQLAQVVLMTPWSMKSWIGVMSDCFPIGRYHKKGYMLLSSVIGVLGLFGLLSLLKWQPDLNISPELGCWLAAIQFLMINAQASTFDLLSEGKYAELMRKSGGGGEILTLVWGCFNAGALAGAVLVYLLIDRFGVPPLLWLCLIPMLLAAFMVMRRYVPEEPAKSRRLLALKLKSQPRLFTLAICMACGSLVLALAAALASTHVRLIITLVVSIVLNCLCFRAMPRTLALSNCYMFLSQAAYINISGPLGYYYTATDTCVADGPHFSYGYYLAVSNFVGALAGGLGSCLFQVMSTWTFRHAFCMTTLAQVFASLFDIVIVKRWNVRVGISDQSMYLFGDAAIGSLAVMLIMYPQALLTSRLCPRGVEATVYALLAGFQNFGQNVSSVLGAWLSETLDIDSSGAARTPGAAAQSGACDFTALPLALIIGHVALPILVLPLTYFMVPDARMDDERAFEVVSPPPSFQSPPGSPVTSAPASPHSWPDQVGSPHAWPDDTAPERAGYEALPGEPLAEVEVDQHMSMVMVDTNAPVP